jgi:hypothetical protein
MRDAAPFAVGENLATTPGHVVLRTEVFELIRCAPQTEQVYPTPSSSPRRRIRTRYELRLRIYLVAGNLSTHKTPAIRDWAGESNVELVFRLHS